VLGFVAVADERQSVLLLGAVGSAQHLHAEHVGVEADRALQIADPQHGVKDAHGFPNRLALIGS